MEGGSLQGSSLLGHLMLWVLEKKQTVKRGAFSPKLLEPEPLPLSPDLSVTTNATSLPSINLTTQL